MNVEVEIPYPLNLYALVPHLMNLYPRWDEWDIREFIVERIGKLHSEDFQTLLAIYLSVDLKRKDFRVSDDDS